MLRHPARPRCPARVLYPTGPNDVPPAHSDMGTSHMVATKASLQTATHLHPIILIKLALLKMATCIMHVQDFTAV